jgi:hypothetical protein
VPESGGFNTALNKQSPEFTALKEVAVANWQVLGLSSTQATALTQSQFLIADLPGTQLALTTDNLITIDVDAAGNGWFIDPTPTLNEEFTPTNSAWEFQAMPNSEGEGKADLFTVIAHELGHVMGFIDRNPLATPWLLLTGLLPFGIRRLPTPFDFVPELGSAPVQPLEIWSPSTGTRGSIPVSQAQHGPSHAGIFNSNFAISDQLSANFGWDESGAVTIANGQAVLSEDSNVISTLSQLFTLPAGSTHLRFTLLDVNLSSNVSPFTSHGSQDAFEVALLESSTLTPLAGVTAGLTQTDSLFNLQQDGTVRFSSSVSLSNGTTSGSTLDLTQPVIVDIELTGIATGAGARFSFDLLGFGDHTSSPKTEIGIGWEAQKDLVWCTGRGYNECATPTHSVTNKVR